MGEDNPGMRASGCCPVRGEPSLAEMRASYRPMVRAVLRVAGLLLPEAFEGRTPSEYDADPAAIRGLADAVGSLAGIHAVAARHGAEVVSPTCTASATMRMPSALPPCS